METTLRNRTAGVRAETQNPGSQSVCRKDHAEIGSLLGYGNGSANRQRDEWPVGGEDREMVRVLSGWKEIAHYLNRGVRTVQRWEQFGLPVHRPHGERRSAVTALPEELDAWVAATPSTGPATIAELQAENTRLRAEIERLRSELDRARNLSLSLGAPKLPKVDQRSGQA